MRRLSTTQPFTCVTCELVIGGPAVLHVGLPFCCAGCVAGGPCVCSYDAADEIPLEASVPAPVLVGASAD